MISLNDVPLIVDNDEYTIEKYIDKYINPVNYLPWLRRSWPGLGLAGLTYPLGFKQEPVFKLNRFRWPTGASRWAYGHFIADVNACQLANLIDATISPSGKYTTVPFVMDTSSSGGEALDANVYLLPPTPLSGIRGVNGLYLLTIVDVRFFWYYCNMGDFSVDSMTTWMSLYQYVLGRIKISFPDTTITIDTIDSKYLAPSTMFNLPYEPVPAILDAIASNVGQRVSVFYNGNIGCMNAGTALQLLNDNMTANINRKVLSGGQRFSSPL